MHDSDRYHLPAELHVKDIGTEVKLNQNFYFLLGSQAGIDMLDYSRSLFIPGIRSLSFPLPTFLLHSSNSLVYMQLGLCIAIASRVLSEL